MPLLVNPAPRGAIAAGKWLAATSTSMMSVMVTTVLCLVMLQFVPLQDLGIRFRFSGAQIALFLATVLPLCPLATGMQIYLSTFARSFKEAQNYMGFLIMVPMLPGMVATLYPLSGQTWMYPIPILSQHVLLADVLGGKTPGVEMFLLGALVSLASAVLLLTLTTRLLHREAIIFGR